MPRPRKKISISEFNSAVRLGDIRPRPWSIPIPSPAVAKIDELVGKAELAGQPDRGTLIGAAVLHLAQQDLDEEALARIIIDYRKTTVAELELPADE